MLARLLDSDDVERLVSDFEGIPEVDRVNSTFVVARQKDTARPLQSYSLETLQESLSDE